MTTQSLVPNAWRLNQARLFQESVQADGQPSLYFFAGVCENLPNTGAVPLNDDVFQTTIGPYRDMILAKRVMPGDVSLVIPNVAWQSGNAYARYDDSDPQIFTEQFYAIVNAGAFYHVWKVLDNGGNVGSTVAPSFADVDGTDDSYVTSDGYNWKYVYSVDAGSVAQFGSTTWFPLQPNAMVSALATPGAVDVVSVDEPGSGYGNYLLGTFTSQDVRVNGNTLLYDLSSNSQASPTSGFYTGCLMYISAGTGQGQFATITNYFVNSNGNFAVIDQEFDITPTNASQFQVYPEVVISGDGSQTANAAARAIINSAGNTVQRVDVLARGAGYKFLSAQVVANASVFVTTGAVVRPIYAPPGGHGHDAAAELGCNAVAITCSLANSEGNSIPYSGQYQQVGLMTSPELHGLALNFTGASQGTFTAPEQLLLVERSIELHATGVSVSATSANLTHSGGVPLTSQLLAGDSILITSNTGTIQQLAQVAQVVNSSTLVLTQNSAWLDSNASASLLTLVPAAQVRTSSNSTSIIVDQVSQALGTGSLVLGGTSWALATVASRQISGHFTDQIALACATRLDVVGASAAAFSQGEIIWQGQSQLSATSTGVVQSYYVTGANTGTIYACNTTGTFTSGVFTGVTGETSGASATVSVRYGPEIEFESGTVVYLQDVGAVPRQNNQTEHLSVVLTF